MLKARSEYEAPVVELAETSKLFKELREFKPF
jgi:hypothetical protein